jgi:hypothetical protein
MVKKTKISRILLIVFIGMMIAPSTALFAQGLNNNFPIDSADIKNIINMLGIEVYKFPLKKQTDKCRLKIIAEGYTNHKLDSKDVLTNAYPDAYVSMNDSGRTLRIYKRIINDTTLEFRVDMESTFLFFQSIFAKKDSLSPYAQICRGYTDFQPIKGKTVPIFIWCGWKQGRTGEMHCPGESPVAKAAELYDFVVAISVELEDLKGE